MNTPENTKTLVKHFINDNLISNSPEVCQILHENSKKIPQLHSALGLFKIPKNGCP